MLWEDFTINVKIDIFEVNLEKQQYIFYSCCRIVSLVRKHVLLCNKIKVYLSITPDWLPKGALHSFNFQLGNLTFYVKCVQSTITDQLTCLYLCAIEYLSINFINKTVHFRVIYDVQLKISFVKILTVRK